MNDDILVVKEILYRDSDNDSAEIYRLVTSGINKGKYVLSQHKFLSRPEITHAMWPGFNQRFKTKEVIDIMIKSDNTEVLQYVNTLGETIRYTPKVELKDANHSFVRFDRNNCGVIRSIIDDNNVMIEVEDDDTGKYKMIKVSKDRIKTVNMDLPFYGIRLECELK